jgi:hypothetical protein
VQPEKESLRLVTTKRDRSHGETFASRARQPCSTYCAACCSLSSTFLTCQRPSLSSISPFQPLSALIVREIFLLCRFFDPFWLSFLGQMEMSSSLEDLGTVVSQVVQVRHHPFGLKSLSYDCFLGCLPWFLLSLTPPALLYTPLSSYALSFSPCSPLLSPAPSYPIMSFSALLLPFSALLFPLLLSLVLLLPPASLLSIAPLCPPLLSPALPCPALLLFSHLPYCALLCFLLLSLSLICYPLPLLVLPCPYLPSTLCYSSPLLSLSLCFPMLFSPLLCSPHFLGLFGLDGDVLQSRGPWGCSFPSCTGMSQYFLPMNLLTDSLSSLPL